jgi:hypothetical protein
VVTDFFYRHIVSEQGEISYQAWAGGDTFLVFFGAGVRNQIYVGDLYESGHGFFLRIDIPGNPHLVRALILFLLRAGIERPPSSGALLRIGRFLAPFCRFLRRFIKTQLILLPLFTTLY